jgi:hypothetical protein
MTGERVQHAGFTRPKYGLVANDDNENGGNPFRKAALLALLAVASGLVIVIPESDDSFELATELSADATSAPASATRSLDGSDELAIGPDRITAPRQVGGAESAGDGGDTTSSQSSSQSQEWSMMDELQAAQASASLSLRSRGDETTDEAATDTTPEATTSTAPPTTRAATTTSTEAATTSAPTTAAPTSSSSTDQAAGDQVAGGETAGDEADGEQAQADTTDSTDTADPADTADATDQDLSDTTETTQATDPTEGSDQADTTETTVAETTTSTTAAPADGTEGWVDTGNGVLVPPVLLAIRFCESTDNYQAANRSSTARGAYQFLTGSWDWYGHKDRYGVAQAHLATNAQQDEAALLTWQQDGTRPWNASRHCWANR